MADITKRVDRHIPVVLRSQNFTNADATAGDVILVNDSLGKPATHVTIETSNGAVQLRLNVYQTIYPRRPYDALLRNDLDNIASGVLLNTSSGVTAITNDTAGIINVEAGETYSLDREIPVMDIQLVTVSGNFDIFVT